MDTSFDSGFHGHSTRGLGLEMNFHSSGVLLLAVLLFGCATPYKPLGTLGGYQDKRLSTDRFSVRYVVNGNATKLSLQTYWLYRAAELTLANGYDGFEIISPVVMHAHVTNHTLLTSHDAGLAYRLNLSDRFVGPGVGVAPAMDGEIQLLRLPFRDFPPQTFDARRLLNELRPFVEGEKCQKENVCPHDPYYLYPKQSVK